MRSALKWAYLVVIHLALIAAVALLIGAIQVVRAERRLPGSSLSADFSNDPTKQEWAHFIKQDGRGVIASVIERSGIVTAMGVAPPDTTRSWIFHRDNARAPWQLDVIDYGERVPHNPATTDAQPVRFFVDGGPQGLLDGIPESLVEATPNRRLFRLSTPEQTLVNERAESLSEP